MYVRVLTISSHKSWMPCNCFEEYWRFFLLDARGPRLPLFWIATFGGQSSIVDSKIAIILDCYFGAWTQLWTGEGSPIFLPPSPGWLQRWPIRTFLPGDDLDDCSVLAFLQYRANNVWSPGIIDNNCQQDFCRVQGQLLGFLLPSQKWSKSFGNFMVIPTKPHSH